MSLVWANAYLQQHSLCLLSTLLRQVEAEYRKWHFAQRLHHTLLSVCRLAGLSVSDLRPLSRLQYLALEDLDLEEFSACSSWKDLGTLELAHNCFKTVPANLAALTSLTSLSMGYQMGDFQLEEDSMDFLTQLNNLRSVNMTMGSLHAWTGAIMFALTRAWQLIDSTPDCHVKLSA